MWAWTATLRRLMLLAGALMAWTEASLHAVILYDTGDPLANTTAPTGIYQDSGWDFQGTYGGFLGTKIAPQYFITAQHFGLAGGNVFDGTYTIDTSANGGVGYWNISGTDLRVFKINEVFSTYAPIYTGSSEVGMAVVVFGRGGPRGSEVMMGSDLKGWYHTGADGVMRWGNNDVSSVVNFGNGDLLRMSFDPISGQNEATLSSGDSGGGVFVNDGGVWKLVGINYGVDGQFDTNNVTDDNEFDAALFDRGGYYQGSDAGGWSSSTLPPGSAASFYASRISDSAAEIESIIATPVPEPGSAVLVMLAAVGLWRRRRL